MKTIEERILALSKKYSKTLRLKIKERIREMKKDDVSHHLLYRVLGITAKEGKLIDEYQNMGRFLYKYAGSFLEEATILCFEEKFPQAERKLRIQNKLGSKPATFEIDCLVDKHAYEIKWRDATTDGDHITKEHIRVKNIRNAGYTPVRIMFYYPNRKQAIQVQETLKTVYAGVGGEYYFGEKAWEEIKMRTDVDLFSILEKIANQIKTDNQSQKQC
ncbi:MAG: ApaLI family restriction endonuclease [Candidatus Paceibacterota bacterium]